MNINRDISVLNTARNTLSDIYSTSQTAFLAWAYVVILGREIDVDGMQHYASKLSNGADRLDVLFDLTNSNEARQLSSSVPTLTDRDFILAAYRQHLHREPDPDGFNFYLKRLTQGTRRNEILQELISSPECKANAKEQQKRSVLEILKIFQARRPRGILRFESPRPEDFLMTLHVLARNYRIERELAELREQLGCFLESQSQKFSNSSSTLPPQLEPQSTDVSHTDTVTVTRLADQMATSDHHPIVPTHDTQETHSAVSASKSVTPECASIYYNNRIDELHAYLKTERYKGVYVMGSLCMGWHEVFKQRHHHIAEYLMDEGYLVICAMNPVYPEDFTDCIKRDRDRLFLVNFENRDIWRQIIDFVALESVSPIFYHLVGTESGTTLEDVILVKRLGYIFIYDYLDEISKEINPALADLCLIRHNLLLQDDEILLVTSADNLYRKSLPLRTRNVICAPNGVRLEDWKLDKGIPAPVEIAHVVQTGKPIVGYYGSFASWMNYDYIRELSHARPDMQIVMIGYDYDWGRGDFANSRISDLQNVHIVPAQKYQNLKYFSRYFDVGVIPFREYELTKSVSPVKMFEYMAQGIPVVASGMNECLKYKSCFVAENADEFVDMVGRALKLKNDQAYIGQLQLDARNNTWEKRGKVIENAMLAMLPKQLGKLLTIAVPAYNMAKLLPRCIDSMLARSQYNNLDIIIVNDGSKDETLDVARDYESRYPNTIRVFDKKNGGHGSCINVGIREAKGKYFKIVDADDWLNPLDLILHLNFLARHDTDMVVTNYVRTFDGKASEVVSYEDRLKEARYAADDFYRSLMLDNSYLSYAHMHAITYRTDILQQQEIRITENSFYVDQEYIAVPQRYIRDVEYQNITLYRYYIGRPGQSVSPEVARKRAPDNYNILRNIISLTETLPELSLIRKYILNIAFHQTWFYLEHSDDAAARRQMLKWWEVTDFSTFAELANAFGITKHEVQESPGGDWCEAGCVETVKA